MVPSASTYSSSTPAGHSTLGGADVAEAAFTAAGHTLGRVGRRKGYLATAAWLPGMPSSPIDQGQSVVSLPDEPARQRFGDQVGVSTLPMECINRAVTGDAADGFIKAVHRSNGTVLGATVVGRQAAEALQHWSIAAAHGLKMVQVPQVMQAYPSPAMDNQQIAWDAYLGGLTQELTGRVLRWLSRQPSPRLGAALLAAQFRPYFCNFGVAEDAEHVYAPVLYGYAPDGVAAVLHRDQLH